MAVVLRSIGIVSPLGNSVSEFTAAIEQQRSVLEPLEVLSFLDSPMGAKVHSLSIRSILKKRKEAKLFTRAAKLGLISAHQCLDGFRNADMGLFVAVGREPPDEGSAEASLIASQKEGVFHEDLLANIGRALYPPLLPLKTLPNMILAHIAIQLDIMGENACWAGGPSMGVQAFRSGFWAIKEGRCRHALIGGADSFISLGAARDLNRTSSLLPSEAGVFFLIETAENPAPGSFVLYPSNEESQNHSIEEMMGYTGSVQALLELVFLLSQNEIIEWGGISFRKQLQ